MFLGFAIATCILIGISIEMTHRLRLAVLHQEPIIIREPERCASCGGVLPKGEDPVEFTGVPVPALMGKELIVHFKTCQSCVAMAP